MSLASLSARLPAAIGVAGMLAAGAIMTGWIVQIPQLVQAGAGRVMVFNTALCFTLIAAALILNDPASPRRAVAQQIIGSGILTIAALVGSQYRFDYSLGIDWPALHNWLAAAPYPGRMLKPAVVGLLLCGAVLVLMHSVSRLWGGLLVQALTVATVAVGVLGLTGIYLELEQVYPHYLFGQFAAHTAIAFIIAGVGLWLCWREAHWYRIRRLIAKEDQRITLVGIAIPGAVVFAAMITGFRITQGAVKETLADGLRQTLRSDVNTFTINIEQRIERARILATRPGSIDRLQKLRAQPDDQAIISSLRKVAETFLPLGVTGVAYHSPEGREWLRVGHFAEQPELSVNLAQPQGARLLWNRGFVLRTRVPMVGDGEFVGTVVLEQTVPTLTRTYADAKEFGETGEVSICAVQDDQFRCFPQRLMPRVFSTPYSDTQPMAHAIAGRTGIADTRDYRNQYVIAAHAPIGSLGLGMVVKMDTVELYEPIRARFEAALLLLCAMGAAGAALLYWRIRPLAGELERSRESIRRQGERALDESERRRAVIVDSAMDAIISLDEGQRIVLFNVAAEKMFGYTSGEMIGQPLDRLLPWRSRDVHRSHVETFGKTGVTNRAMGHLGTIAGVRASGEDFPIEASISQTGAGATKLYTVILRDITERRQAEQTILRQRDLYDTLSQTNQTIVRCTSRDELFREICRIAVQHGRFRFAWIGLTDSVSQGVRPVAQSGTDAGYVDEVTVRSTPARSERRGPTEQAMLTGRTVISNDFLNDPATVPWQEAGRKAGVGASGAFPIRQGGTVVGTLNLYASTPGFFTDDILPTLDEMATDVSFALDNFAREDARRRIEQALRESEEQLRLFVHYAPSAIAMFDRDMRYIVFSRRWLVDYGLGDQDLTGRSHYDVFPSVPERWKEIHRRCLAGAVERCDEDPFPRIDGRTDWVRWEVRPWYADPTTAGGIIIFSEVITARKQAEEQLQHSFSRLQELSRRLVEVEEEERRNINRELHDRVGQDLAAVKLNIELIRVMLGEDMLRVVGTRIDDAQRMVQSAIDHARNIMAELRPRGLDDFGIFTALQMHAEVVTQRLGIPVRVNGGDAKPRLPSMIETALYRIAQEALNNVAKHGRAKNVEVMLAVRGSEVTLSVADDGAGFDVSTAPTGSYGLRIMRERAEAAGARLEIESAVGRGTRIVVKLERRLD